MFMENITNHLVDYLVLGTILLSGILALARRFVRECLALISWIAAIWIAMHFSGALKPVLAPYIHDPEVLNIIAKSIIFIIILSLLSTTSYFVAKFVRTPALSAVDRSLGFIFGAARGFLIACLVYLLCISFIVPKEKPEMLKTAKTEPMLEAGSRWINDLIPADEKKKFQEKFANEKETAKNHAVNAVMQAAPESTNAPGNPQSPPAQQPENQPMPTNTILPAVPGNLPPQQ